MPTFLHTIELPRMFYEDHCDRMSDQNPDEPAFSDKPIQWKGKTVIVEACDEALNEIEADADYYAEQTEESMPGYRGLIASARTTLRRIAEYRAQHPSNQPEF